MDSGTAPDHSLRGVKQRVFSAAERVEPGILVRATRGQQGVLCGLLPGADCRCCRINGLRRTGRAPFL